MSGLPKPVIQGGRHAVDHRANLPGHRDPARGHHVRTRPPNNPAAVASPANASPTTFSGPSMPQGGVFGACAVDSLPGNI
jgi:hypothetical protein